MLEKWTGEVVGTMHIYGITHRQLADRIGITNRYLSMLLNGKRKSQGSEGRVRAALMDLINERSGESANAESY